MTRALGAIVSLVAFGVAVYTFSELWGAFSGAWQGRPTLGPAALLVVLAGFLASLTALGYMIYATDRAAGRVRRRIAVFDRILDRGRHQ